MIKTFEMPDTVNETPSGRARAEAVSTTQGRLVRATESWRGVRDGYRLASS